MPDIVEKAGLAARRGHEPDRAVGAADERRNCRIALVLDEGGFVHDEDVGGVADTGVLTVGDGENGASVG